MMITRTPTVIYVIMKQQWLKIRMVHLQIRDQFNKMNITMVISKLMSRRRKKTEMMMTLLKVNSAMRMMTQRLKKGQVRLLMGLLVTTKVKQPTTMPKQKLVMMWRMTIAVMKTNMMKSITCNTHSCNSMTSMSTTLRIFTR